MDHIPRYIGKPTLYLDHNIIDLFVKDGIGNFGLLIKENFRVVYSDESLKEIKRSRAYENDFLKVLTGLGAFHLKIYVEPSGFVITDRATISDRDVFKAFEEYCSNDDQHGCLEKSFSQLLYKFLGGRPDDSISIVFEEQLDTFIKLMEGVINDGSDLLLETRIELDNYSKSMVEDYRAALQDLGEVIVKEIPDTTDWNPIKAYREALRLNTYELNNIQPPKVIEKIWNVVKVKIPDGSGPDCIEKLFGLSKCDDKFSHMHQKVTGMYNMLNTLGYFPDSYMHKERRFISAMSDTSHASMASFCDFLLSRDVNFVNKVSAVYEYLAVPTKVMLVKDFRE